MIYYVYVKEQYGKHVIYGQSQDILKRMKFTERQKERDMNMLPFGAIS